MGCSQSTVKDQVHDNNNAAAAAAAPAEGETVVASAPPSNDLVFQPAEESAAADAAPASATAAPASTTAAPVESAAEDAAVAAPVEEVVAPVEEAPVSTASAAAAVAEEDAAPVAAEATTEAAPASAASAAVEEVVEAVVDEVTEAAVAEPAAAVVEEAEVAVVAAEPEAEAASAVDETKTVGLVFVSAGVSFGDKGVAYYNFTASNVEDPAQDVKISKRFNDFKALHADVATLMANEAHVAPEHQDKFATYPALPALPKTSLFRSRNNAKQTEEREAQFLAILNAIARHPIAFESPKFKAFLA